MKDVAILLEVSTKTLQNWKRNAKKEVRPKLGRPSRSKIKVLMDMKFIYREWLRQGRPGIRPVAEVLEDVPRRLINELVPKLNNRFERREKERIKRNRVCVKVLATNALWSQDGTHIGRNIRYKAYEAQIIKDRGSFKVHKAKSGVSAVGADVISLLENMKEEEGLPLVWMTDNGSCYNNEDVESYCEREKVIHLKSRARVPQDNGAAERHIQEIKKVAVLGKGILIDELSAAQESLNSAQKVLNENRLYQSLGMMTAIAKEQKMPKATELINRDVFYSRCMKRVKSFCAGKKTGRQRRYYEREAIYQTLQEFNLIERRRNGRLIDNAKPEVFL
jgi:transposase InsO family protein